MKDRPSINHGAYSNLIKGAFKIEVGQLYLLNYSIKVFGKQ